MAKILNANGMDRISRSCRIKSKIFLLEFLSLICLRTVQMKKIQKILVANRGEIALRVIRSAREMGIRTVAIYSEADRGAPHVINADEAVAVGPPPSSESYLKIDTIIQAALDTGSDAIHPGYGFLAENSRFATQVSKAGLIFIGPSPKAIKTMGNKLAAKAAIADTGIAMVPGHHRPVSNLTEAQKAAQKIGYPVLVKASAGGGGKGMRVVEKKSQFKDQLERAISEATSAFGDGAVFIEKFITNPKHIEIQILADNHDNFVHLFERECSIQRRYQKVIEEAPSAAVNPEMRMAMGQAAVKVAKACKYQGAGTVEFVVDKDLNFYFLEMNTRLQVEHPVTEFITGIDLVKQQIKIAQNLPLSFKQEEIRLEGHAVEARIYAEDPQNEFLPDTGRLNIYETPQGSGIRVDGGYRAGMGIPIYYDPLIAKVISYGSNRKEAIEKLGWALKDFHISGVETTIDFCRFVLEHPSFKSGEFDTGFVESHFSSHAITRAPDPKEAELAAALAGFLYQEEILTGKTVSHSKVSSWKKRVDR